MSHSANKRIAKNTAFLYIRMILILIVSIYTTRIVLNALGVVDYGINNVVAGFVSMFAFLNTSMANGIQRFYNFTLGQKDTNITNIYNTALQIQSVLAIIILLLLETVGLWYMYNEMKIPSERFDTALWCFQFAVMSTTLLIMQAPYASAIMAYEKMDYYACVGMVDVIAKLLIAYLLTISDMDKLMLYSFLNLLVSLITFLLYFVYSKYKFKDLRFKFAIDRSLFKPMLSFSGWNIFGTFAYMLKGQGLNLLLNFYFGPIVNSARGVSNMIMSALQGFQANIVIAFRPQIVQSYSREEYERVLHLFYSLSRISFLMLTIMSLPIILEINYILKVWLGDAVPEYTKSFTILILLNMIVSSLTTPLSQIVHATGKMRTYQLVTSLIVFLIVPISWLLLRFGYNPNAVYYTSLIITIINQIVCNIVVKKIFPYSLMEYFKAVIVPCFILLGLSFILPNLLIINIMEESFIRLVITTSISILLSCIIAYFVVLNKMERNMILNFVRKNNGRKNKMLSER